jgi:hypothetical protein
MPLYLQRQAMAALRTTRLQNLAATERAAARAEAVRSGAFDLAGLKCSFHCLEPVPVYSANRAFYSCRWFESKQKLLFLMRFT